MSDELPESVDLRPFVRIRRSELAAVCLQHVASGIDLSVAATGSGGAGAPVQAGLLAGYTQWGATWQALQVYVRWNWGISQNLLFVLNPAAIKANIQLLDDTGSVESFLLSRAHLFECIEALPWRDTLRDVIPQLR